MTTDTYTATCEDCGHTTTSKTEKLAAHGIHMHSCEKTRRKEASRARRLARSAAVDRTPKPCLHKRANHVHGTHACYVLDRCRCTDCTRASADYEKHRKRLHAYGRFTHLVDAQPARDHVHELIAQGLGLKTLANISGVSGGALSRLMYGSKGQPASKRIHRDTETRILAVRATIDTLAPGAITDGTGTRRRLQALMTLGWSQTRLAAALDYQTRNFGHLINGTRGVTVATAHAVRALYDNLWDQAPTIANHWEAGGSNRARKYATERGWVPPMAWDDDTIDDPNATPHVDEHEPRAPRRLIHLDDIADFIDWGHDLPTTARRLNVTPNAIEVALARADRLDLLDALHRNSTDPHTCHCGRVFNGPQALQSHNLRHHTERKTA